MAIANLMLALAAAIPVAVPSAAAATDRPMGQVYDWSHELKQQRLPAWDPRAAPPVPAPAWNRTIDGLLRTAGRNHLWFSGYAALPFDVPLHPKEPAGWRTPSVFGREYRATGLSWDVNLEARAATRALAAGATVVDAREVAPTRRGSLISPAYERAAAAEIRRLVPRYAKLPYVSVYTGSDEPVVLLPRGRATTSGYATRLRREVKTRFGWAPPSADAKPTTSVTEGLRWLAYSRYTSDRFFAMKARQTALIHRLDPGAVVSPNDYVFLDGFMPWDYTRLAGFADIVEGDPYVSLLERSTPGRGRYNHGFGAKFLSDLTGKPVRIIVQAFPYAGYRPMPDDLDTWTAQALRAGATHISFYALSNPRFTDRPFYDRMLAIARELHETRLPEAPVDPATLVVYATMSEGQARPALTGQARYRTGGNALYTTYSLLGELAHGAFTFDADTRLLAEPARLDAAKLVWLPRADTLDRKFAERLRDWVVAGGTLVVTDPAAFRRAPDGSSLSAVHDALLGTTLGPARSGQRLAIDAGAIAPGLPAAPLTVTLRASVRRPFATVPAGATVIGRFVDGAPGAIVRPVGAGRVIAFSTDPMDPRALIQPAELTTLVAAIQTAGGGRLGHPAWNYTLPGAPNPAHPPWPGAYVP